MSVFESSPSDSEELIRVIIVHGGLLRGRGGSERLLAFWPNLNEILENLKLLHY